MFGSTKVSKPKEETIPHLTSDDEFKTRKYLLRNLRYYINEDEDDPDSIAMVCGIVDALNKLKNT